MYTYLYTSTATNFMPLKLLIRKGFSINFICPFKLTQKKLTVEGTQEPPLLDTSQFG